MPDDYRAQLAADALPAVVRPLNNWSAHELVAAVLSATTTEARLWLAKALSLSHDWQSARGFATKRNEPWIELTSAPGWTRTSDLPVSGQALFLSELRGLLGGETSLGRRTAATR